MQTGLANLRAILRNAPPLTRPTAPGRVGWTCEAGFICASCGVRAIRAGAYLPDESKPARAPGACVLCGEGVAT